MNYYFVSVNKSELMIVINKVTFGFKFMTNVKDSIKSSLLGAKKQGKAGHA